MARIGHRKRRGCRNLPSEGGLGSKQAEGWARDEVALQIELWWLLGTLLDRRLWVTTPLGTPGGRTSTLFKAEII
jgi:hypothetical protein